MKLWRRIWAMCLCMVMLTMVAACGGEEGTKEPDPDTNGGNDVENNDENGGNEESEYPPVLTEEISPSSSGITWGQELLALIWMTR